MSVVPPHVEQERHKVVSSLPSKEVYIADVPELKEFIATFKYNFFVHDESSSDAGGIPQNVLSKTSLEADAAFVNYATSRVPRYVELKFAPVVVTKFASNDAKADGFNVDRASITKNVDNVMTEDNIASDSFVAASFHDGEIDDKVYYFVSGSCSVHSLLGEKKSEDDPITAANTLAVQMPEVSTHFLQKAMSNVARASGTRFYADQNRITDTYFDRIKRVMTNAQINKKLFSSITDKIIRDPHSMFAENIIELSTQVKRAKASVENNATVSELDYKPLFQYVAVKMVNTAYHDDSESEARVIGYIIDKVEITPSGRRIEHKPLIIESEKISSAIDVRVKYGSTYAYTIRAIAQFTMSAIDDDTGDVALITILVSSKPSNTAYVRTIENVAPPHPADFSFTWDYERINPHTAEIDPVTRTIVPFTGIAGSLLLYWSFPPNPQRDIKKFQVFRRSTIKQPFMLIKEYDFDDSDIKYVEQERPLKSLVEMQTSPSTFFYDDDFVIDNERTESTRYIYAVASVDAHGISSCYSDQFEVWFDRLENRLKKNLISHGGAPKPYPNLYIDSEALVNSIKVAGSNTKKMTLYFNPVCYRLHNDDDVSQKIIATKQDGVVYKLQMVNIDNAQGVTVNVTLDDRQTSDKGQSTKTVHAGAVTHAQTTTNSSLSFSR